MMLSAKQGEKCFCGKRATATLMSADGQRALMPCCMKCGLVCQEFRRREKDDSDAHGLSPELRHWYATDSGLSSKTIAAVLVPELRSCLAECDRRTPADPSDFGRCYRLLRLIPNGVKRLAEVAARYPEWAGLVHNWEELTSLYLRELPSGNAPLLYQRIKELTGGARLMLFADARSRSERILASLAPLFSGSSLLGAPPWLAELVEEAMEAERQRTLKRLGLLNDMATDYRSHTINELARDMKAIVEVIKRDAIKLRGKWRDPEQLNLGVLESLAARSAMRAETARRLALRRRLAPRRERRDRRSRRRVCQLSNAWMVAR